MAVRLPFADRAIPVVAALMGATFGAVTDADTALETVLGGAFVALLTASLALIVANREPRAAIRSRAVRIVRASFKRSHRR